MEDNRPLTQEEATAKEAARTNLLLEQASDKIQELIREKESLAQHNKDLAEALLKEQLEGQRLEAKLVEALEVPWPDWAETIYKLLLKHEAVERGEEVDLGEALTEWVNGWDDAGRSDWERGDIRAQKLRIAVRNGLSELRTEISKVHQWTKESSAVQSMKIFECTTRMLIMCREAVELIDTNEREFRAEAVRLGFVE